MQEGASTNEARLMVHVIWTSGSSKEVDDELMAKAGGWKNQCRTLLLVVARSDST